MENQEPFKISLRGFDRDEVLAYLQDLSRRHELELQHNQSEIARLKEQNQALAGQIQALSAGRTAAQSAVQDAEDRLAQQVSRSRILEQEIARLKEELRLSQAQRDAVTALVSETRARCTRIMEDTRAQSDAVLHSAEQRRDEILREAQNRASVILSRSQEDADKVQNALQQRCDSVKQAVASALAALSSAAEACNTASSIADDPFGFLFIRQEEAPCGKSLSGQD